MKLYTLFEAEDDIIVNASGHFKYNGEEFPYWGNHEGSTKTINYDVGKFNRYAKLGFEADDVIRQLQDSVKDERGVAGRCAFAALLMMKYGVRVGNEDSASGYESGLELNKGQMVQTFGITTLQNQHISFEGNQLRLKFLGKEQVEQDVVIDDPFIVEQGRKMHSSLPEDKWIGVDYDTMFKFVKSRIGKSYVPKDLRTYCANIAGWRAMKEYLSKPKRGKKSEAKKELAAVIESVAAKLGNTPGVCRSMYLDSRMGDWFVDQRYEEAD